MPTFGFCVLFIGMAHSNMSQYLYIIFVHVAARLGTTNSKLPSFWNRVQNIHAAVTSIN